MHELVHEQGYELLKSDEGGSEPDVQKKLIELKQLRDELLKKLRMLCMQTENISGMTLHASDDNASKLLQDK